jgi:MOSC domain-containing protein YiiM
MRVLSVNVGLPREVTWRGKPVRTGIYKESVRGRVAVATLNLAGDAQADLRVHGGRDKAVYAYPSEYYELWSRERPELELGPGTFGENLTTEGLLDEDVSIGYRFRFGTAELVVTQPRLPCFKLGIKMWRDEFVTEFLERGLYGFYLAVTGEGHVEAGDPIVALTRDPHRFGVNEIARLYARARSARHSPTERRQTSGMRARSRSVRPSPRRRRARETRTVHCVCRPKIRLFRARAEPDQVHAPAQAIRSARSSSGGSQSAGTSSRRESSASSRASTLSVLAAAGATVFSLRASADFDLPAAGDELVPYPECAAHHLQAGRHVSAQLEDEPSEPIPVSSDAALARDLAAREKVRAPLCRAMRPSDSDILHLGPHSRLDWSPESVSGQKAHLHDIP